MEAEDEGGATPLHLAAAATRAAAARLLLDEAGARPEARDRCGRSPLDLASLLRPSSTEIVTPLLARAGAAANSAADSAANGQAAEGSAACEEHRGAPLAAASATSASSASPGRDAPPPPPPPPPLPTSAPLAAYRARALQAPP